VSSIAISGSNIFAGTDNGIFLSTDNGTTWTSVNSGLPNGLNYVAVSGSNVFAVAEDGGIFLSTDNGSNWTLMNNGFTSYPLYSLAISGSNIFAGTEGGGVYLSTNNGSTWTAINNGLTGGGLVVASLAIKGDYIIAGTGGGAWKRSLSEVLSLNVSTNLVSIDAQANSTATFNITSNVNWTITNPETWITVSSTSGYGDKTITLTAQENTEAASRTSTVTISSIGLTNKIVTVTQEGIATGINEIENNSIKIYPNPAKDYLMVDVLDYSNMQDYSIKIINQLGKIVFETIVTQPQYEIDLSSWSGKGIYFLQIYDSNKIFKFIEKVILK
jgi:hypothetical protein